MKISLVLCKAKGLIKYSLFIYNIMGNSKKITLSESSNNIKESRDMILNVLSSQINSHKLQHFSNWVGNHNVSPFEKNQKIQKLESLKEEIISFFSEESNFNSEINISFDIKINLKDKEELSNQRLAS